MKCKYSITIWLLLAVLLLVACDNGERQRLQLAELERQNRADSLMLNDSLARDLADWFDRHGTRNEQLRAHYILGRTYADRGESPAALDAYHEAISRADTTSQDCDFAKLSRVYGQSATIFYQQGLYRNALEYENLASTYAWQGNDTLAALQFYAMKAASYNQLQMNDSAILIYVEAIRQLKVYKYYKMAAGFSGLLAFELLKKEEIEKVGNLLKEYECCSSYFNSIGDIEDGREFYYNAKGLYYLKKKNLDSAEYYFRKELYVGKDFGNQNSGSRRLAQLFLLRNQPDSAAKYALYAYDMNDSVYIQRSTHEIEQAKSMYDYSRQQEIAQQESQSATRANNRFLLSLMILLMVLLAASWLYIARRRVIDSLKQTAIELNCIKTENIVLKQDALLNQRQIAENEKRIKTVGEEIR